jgi:hypothetical protein
MIWILLVLISSCPESFLEEADRIRHTQGRIQEMRVLEVRMRGCEPSVPFLAQVANRYIELSEDPVGRERRSSWLESGFANARRALNQDPSSSVANEIMATAFAAKLNQSGLMGQVRLADSVRIYAQAAVDFDPGNPTAHHILARWYFELANVGWFTGMFAGIATDADVSTAAQTALSHFRMAFDLDPSLQNRFWLGRSLDRAGDKRQTRNLYQAGITETAKTDAEKVMQDEMRTWLRKNR